MSKAIVVTRAQYRGARKAVSDGILRAGQSLSTMVGREIRMGTPSIKVVPLRDVPGLAGGPETTVVAAYLGISGDISAHMILCFDLRSAHKLVGYLLEKTPEDPESLEFDFMSRSALSEVGNVTCSSLLNALSDHTGLAIRPSIPVLVVDMAGAILSAALAELGPAGDEAMVIETVFGQEGEAVNGYMFLLPSPEALATIINHLGAQAKCPTESSR
ncbi:MAG: chemotaxis protein CheC [Bacillota bacterium]